MDPYDGPILMVGPLWSSVAVWPFVLWTPMLWTFEDSYGVDLLGLLWTPMAWIPMAGFLSLPPELL